MTPLLFLLGYSNEKSAGILKHLQRKVLILDISLGKFSFWYWHYRGLKVHTFVLQFGMLIEYLFEKFPNQEDVSETAIGDLQVRTYIELYCS
jgi:hypothetical protein